MAETTSLGTLSVYVEAQMEELRKGLNKADKEVRYFAQQADKSTKEVSKSFEGLGKSVGKWAKRFAVVGVAAIAAIGYASIKMGAQFEQAMARVGAISNAVGKEFEDLRNLALKLGRDTEWSASQAAGGMSTLAMAGFKVEEILKAMPGILAAATAGQMDLATATGIVATSIRGFGLEADQSSRISDVLAKTFTSANVTMLDLGESMKYVAPIAKLAGMEFEETAALLGIMGDAGIKGSMAGTQLRFALRRLLAPTGEAKQIIKEIGIETIDAEGKILPFAEIVDQLAEASLGAGDMMTLFGRAASGMSAVIGRGSDDLREFTDVLKESGGTAQRIADIQLDTLTGQFTILKSSMEGLFITIKESFFGDMIKEMLQDVIIPAVNNLADTISKRAPEIKAMISSIVEAILSGVEISIEIVKPFVAAWNTAWDMVKEAISSKWFDENIIKPLKESYNWVKDKVIVAWAFWTKEIKKVEGATEGVRAIAGQLALAYEENLADVNEEFLVFGQTINKVRGIVDNFVESASGIKKVAKEIKAMNEEVLFKFLESLGKSEPLWGKFIDSAKKAFSFLGDQGKKVFEVLGEAASKVGDYLRTGISRAYGFLKGLFEAGMGAEGEAPMRVGAGGVPERVPTGVEAVVQGMMEGVDNFIERLPEILEQIIEWIPPLVEKVVETLPILVKAFAEFIPELAIILAENIPILVLALIEQLPTIMRAIVEAIPILLEGFIEVLPELVKALINFILLELPLMVTALIVNIIDLLPLLITKVIESIPSIIVAAVEFIIVKIPQIVIKLLGAVLANLDDIIIAFAKGVGDAIAEILFGKAGPVAKEYVEPIVDAFKEWGRKWEAGEFQKGSWEIPRNMLAGIHKGEMVIPAEEAENIRRGATGIGRGGGAQFNFTIQSLDPRGVKEVIRDEVIPILQEEEEKGRY